MQHPFSSLYLSHITSSLPAHFHLIHKVKGDLITSVMSAGGGSVKSFRCCKFDDANFGEGMIISVSRGDINKTQLSGMLMNDSVLCDRVYLCVCVITPSAVELTRAIQH